MKQVSFGERDLQRFAQLLDESEMDALEQKAEEARELLADRRLWCISSTAQGGGVAEMLGPLLGYSRGSGIDARWVVIEGDGDFFFVTKRLHHRLHGMPGDGGPLGRRERAIYDRVLQGNLPGLLSLTAPGDVVLVHDPQPAGLIPALVDQGCHVVWRAHIGTDVPNQLVREAWDFLAADVGRAAAYVFSRREYAWDVLDPARTAVIHPSIDAFSPKNQELAPGTCTAMLQTIGVLEGAPAEEPVYARADGTAARVRTPASRVEDAPLPLDAPVILQVSRWDPLKDPVGVLEGFVECAADLGDAHLVLAGPDTTAVTDDPEGARVFGEVCVRRESLAPSVRARVHLVSLAMDDVEENGAAVNALQRHATIVVQKSLAEGFGLTVAEALWKARPVVASRVGGIQDQIQHGVNGVLLDDPRDPVAFAAALIELVRDPARAAAMGQAGQRTVHERFLESRHLTDWATLLGVLLG